MRAHEFITEGRTGSIQDDVAKALPATYALPELENQDPYLQYRFGVAIAGAKGAEKRKQDGGPYIDDALKTMGMTGKKRLSTAKSEEASDVDTRSPVIGFKGW